MCYVIPYIQEMFSSWQEYINDFKALCFSSREELAKHRFSLGEDQLQSYWGGCSLTEMESIFTITNQYALSFALSQLLPPYLSSRRTLHQAYTVSTLDDRNQEQTLLYVYDCKIFRGGSFTKQENDFISSFLLLYKEQHPCSDTIFEVVSPSNLAPSQWVLKVKESCILRVFGYLRDTMHRLRHNQDKVILSPQLYETFMQQWMKCYYNYNIEITSGYFFRGLLILLQNQIMYNYILTLNLGQKEERKYLRPIKVIEKPKNVEQFTLTEGNTETETKWQSLKITAFRLKYRVVETPTKYECFMVQEEVEKDWDREAIDEEDTKIMEGFQKMRKIEEEYNSMYV